MNKDLSFDYLNHFKQNSAALRILSSPHFPLLASFFFTAFIKKNRRSVPYQELVALLDYQLQDIRDSHGDTLFPKSAKAYIDDWINQKLGYLRKYMPQHSDEPECDLLPEVEKAVRWLQELQGREFVGTESRLKMVLDLVANLVSGTSQDTQAKLVTLRKQQAEIGQQITAVEQGMDIGLSTTQVRERMFLVSDMSRQLLGEFRQVEANFRHLDRSTRKTITLSEQSKGKILEQVLSGQDVIDDSDEGSSFSAFFELLMSASMRENLREDLKQLLSLDETREFAQNDELLRHLYAYLLDAGTQVNQTKQLITEHLSRYIQDQSQDNRRIIELIRTFEAQTLSTPELLKSKVKNHDFSLEGFNVDISSVLSRHLFQAKYKEQLDSTLQVAEDQPKVDLTALFEVSQVDEAQLLHNIEKSQFHHHGQTTLAQVIEQSPIENGLDEVLSYLKIACEQQINAHIDECQKQYVSWQIATGERRKISIPLITFVRESPSADNALFQAPQYTSNHFQEHKND